CDLTLVDSHTGDEVWEEIHEIRIDATGCGPELGPLSVTLPDRDGVFDLTVHVSRRRLPTPFAPVKTIGQRSVQLAVLASSAGESTTPSWNVLREIVPQAHEVSSLHDSGKSRLWNPLTKIPHWWWFPGASGNEDRRPLGNGQSSSASRWGEGYVQLAPGGWQAYPLPTGTLLRPHLVEVDYPSDLPQGLSIRVIEPGASGVVTPFGPASGLDIAGGDSQVSGRVNRHRLVFWPKTETPLLLVTNSRPDSPAVFGRVRVFSGPRQLPPAAAARRDEGRLLAAYYDRPLFWEDFAAADAIDELTGRSLNDWRTFQDGGLRMVEYLQYAGYNGAMLNVLHDGGTLYHDNGTFFGTGQDPVRKDVLELLFRLFDRQGMTLIPLLRFSTPLPELELGAEEGIELVGPDGRSWRQSLGAVQPTGAYYNPLDPRVQQAMRRVVVELVDRYGQHPSFGGVAIRLGPDTYAQLPDLAWGLDSQTLARFAEARRLSLPEPSQSDPRQLSAWIVGEQRDAWASWRARQLADFYAAMESDVTDRVAGARLYLAGADMLNHPAILADLHPRLPERLDVREQMKRVGIDPWLYADSNHLVLMRPERIAPLISLEEQAVTLQLRHSPEMHRMFSLRAATDPESTASGEMRPLTGSLFYHDPKSLIPASFRDASPYGADKTSNWFLDQAVPAGDQARKRFVQALAVQDSQVIADGGWVAGQIPGDNLTDVLVAYRQLPAARFETVRPVSAGDETQPVVVRRLSTGQRTYVYLVNHSPWPVQVSVSLDDRRPFTLTGLGDRSLPNFIGGTRDLRWNVEMRPYDFVAASLSAPDVQVRDWQVVLQREVLVELRQSVDELRRRIGRLSDPEPLAVLTNPHFETASSGPPPAGWEHATGNGISVATEDDTGREGQSSL
nr:family 10 glycosylhydrolase [Pirellulaceae bacterium]